MSGNPQVQRQRQQAPATGSRTQVQATPSGSATQTGSTAPAPAILRLRGAHAPSTQRVQWAENVVDNEGLGRKSSKVCCIYHAPKAVGESSDESSSSSDSDSDSDSGTDNAYDPRERALAERRARDQRHCHGPNCAHGREDGHAEDGNPPAKRRPARRPSPNAYEKQPRPKQRSDGGNAGPSGSNPGPGNNS